MTINERVAALRQWMRQQPIAPNAYLIPTTDPHHSEYIAAHWACREWITGFTGSAGLAVVTQTEAVLFTDSRYFLQAEEQLHDTPFTLGRTQSNDPTPEALEWLYQRLGDTPRIGCPADLIDSTIYRIALDLCAPINASTDEVLVCRDDAFDALWTDRPALPSAPISEQPLELAGQSREEKLEQLVKAINHDVTTEADSTLVFNNLEDIAWLLNLRGEDISYNPVFLAYLTYSKPLKQFTLYTHGQTLTPEAASHLAEAGVQLKPYEAVSEVFADERSCYWLATAPIGHLPECFHTHLVDVEQWRCIKNTAEVNGFREAMLRDGVALVKFGRWLDESLAAGKPLTELEVSQKLTAFRAEQPGFKQPSFETIAAYGPHGAIVHYEPTEESNVPLEPHGLLLIDSGAQYDCGTTDITRTYPLGSLTAEERRVYTLVLKGHLRLARAQFPEGTSGLQLDTMARIDIWNEGYNYGHGTGHGVGSHLCVHEGPQSLRAAFTYGSQQALRPGMTITNEPGVYVAGKFGVRIENTQLCVKGMQTDFGSFLRFETLTLCPYQLQAVDLTMLSPHEVDEINDYHLLVRRRLMSLLTDEADRNWLARTTAPIEGVGLD